MGITTEVDTRAVSPSMASSTRVQTTIECMATQAPFLICTELHRSWARRRGTCLARVAGAKTLIFTKEASRRAARASKRSESSSTTRQMEYLAQTNSLPCNCKAVGSTRRTQASRRIVRSWISQSASCRALEQPSTLRATSQLRQGAR